MSDYIINPIKNHLKIVLTAVMLNYFTIPISGSIGNTITFTYFTPKLSNQHTILSQKDEMKSFDFLVYANTFAHKNASLNADCKELSTRTYHLYQDIVRKNSREDLSGSVRMVSAISGKNGHLWIEYKKEESWSGFESTHNLPLSNLDNIILSASLQKDNRSQLEIDDMPDFKTLGGTSIFYPTINSIKSWTGLAGFFYRFTKRI